MTTEKEMHRLARECMRASACEICGGWAPMKDMDTCACGARVCIQESEYVFRFAQTRDTPTLKQWREWKTKAEDVIRERDRYAARIKKLEAERDELRRILK